MQSVSHRRQALGFGCADLPVGDARAALRLLETAFDLGIRHFDVAPLYGRGDAERLLGRFAAGKRDQLRLVTKVGLYPFAPGLKGQVVGAVRRTVQRMPVAERLLNTARSALRGEAAAAPAPAGILWRGRFDLDQTRHSLERSLRALRTDHIDVWLLHEAHAEDAANAELLALLDDARRAGHIGAYGLGTHWRTLLPQQAQIPANHQVWQFENDVLLRPRAQFAQRPGLQFITNRSQHARARCLELLRAQPRQTTAFAGHSGIDSLEPAQLAALLLAWTVDDNAPGTVLFGTRSVEHLRSNLALLDDVRYGRETVQAFGELIACLQQAATA